jgi:hypothetical protein
MGLLVDALTFFSKLLAWLGLSQIWEQDPKSQVRVQLYITADTHHRQECQQQLYIQILQSSETVAHPHT